MAKTLRDLVSATTLSKTDIALIGQGSSDKTMTLDLLAEFIMRLSDQGFKYQNISADTTISSIEAQQTIFETDTTAAALVLTVPFSGPREGTIIIVTNLVGSNVLTLTYASGTSIELPNGGWAIFVYQNGWRTVGNNIQLISKVPTGTQPLLISSTTKVNNLNASFLDGAEKSTDGSFASDSDSKVPTEKAIALFNVPGDKGFTFNSFINKFYKGTGNTIVIPSFKAKIASKTYFTDSSITLSVSDLDTGSAFVFGSDYYIWAGTPASGTAPMLKISLSPSAPTGMTNPRIIGGFHYGKIRNSFTASDVSDSILSASVWDLTHMPSCYILGLMDPTTYQLGGMIEVIPGRTWADIYLASDGGGTIPNKLSYSKINVLPITGTEGLCWYDFAIRGANVGKRMLFYHEWTKLALGSPQGLDASNLNGWTKTSNTARVKTAATVAGDADANYILGYNTSFLGARDCVGNVWEWLADMSNRHDSTSWAYQNVLDAGELAASQDFGQAYLPNNVGMVAWIAGGAWTNGVGAGARAVYVVNVPWYVAAYFGCRFACDSL